MKGILHKTERGWVIIYDEIIGENIVKKNQNSLPLHSDAYSVNGPMKDVVTSWEGQEVEFEIFDNREICSCACHKNPDITHFVACCNNGYKTDNLGHVNYYAKLVDKATRHVTEDDAWPKYPEVKIICPRCKSIMPCECNAPGQNSLLNSIRSNSSWGSILKEFISANSQTKPLTFECWLVENYNPPTKK